MSDHESFLIRDKEWTVSWGVKLWQLTRSLVLHGAAVEPSVRANRSVRRKYIDCERHSAGVAAIIVSDRARIATETLRVGNFMMEDNVLLFHIPDNDHREMCVLLYLEYDDPTSNLYVQYKNCTCTSPFHLDNFGRVVTSNVDR